MSEALYTQQTVAIQVGPVSVTITVTHPFPVPAEALPVITFEAETHGMIRSPEVRS